MPCHFAVDRIAAFSRGVPGLTHRVDDLALDHPAVTWIANCPSRTARRTTCPAKQQPAVEAAKTAGGAEQSHYTPTVTFRETKKDRTRLVLSRPSESEFASSHIGLAHGKGLRWIPICYQTHDHNGVRTEGTFDQGVPAG